MSTKPTIANARWADQAGANLVAPTSGERDLGFQSGTPASAGKVNTELNQLFLWAQYLNDGALSGNHSIAGTLTASGLVTASSGLTAAVNQHITVSGTGRFKYGSIPISISCVGAVAGSGGTAPSITAAGAAFTNVATILIGVSGVNVGEHITAARVRIQDDNSGTTYRVSFADSASTSVNGTTSASSGAAQTISVTGLDYTVVSMTGITLVLTRQGGSGVFTVKAAEVDVDQP